MGPTKPSVAPVFAPPEGYAGLFFRSASRGVPLECFLHIAALVREGGGEHALVLTSQVCTSWRKAIVECGKLWTRLDDLNVCNLNALDRVRAIAARSQGHLERLSLDFDPNEDGVADVGMSTLPVVCKQILREVSRLDGARALVELELDLRSMRYCDDVEPLFACIVLAAQFAEFSAINLRELSILTSLDRFPAGAPFLFALPQLRKLVLTSQQYDPPGDARLPDFFSTTASLESAQITSSSLTSLVLSGVSLMDSTFPSFAQLEIIKLYRVRVSNLYGLLVKCSSTLKTLWLRGIHADSANRFLPPVADSGLKDGPPTLDMPALQHIQLAGSPTPLLWLAPTQTGASFLVHAPFLEKVNFDRQRSHSQLDDDNEGWFEAFGKELTTEVLSNLFRESPQLQKLNLNRCRFSTDIVTPALAFAPATLTMLCIGGTPAATDSFIDRLSHTILPNLEWLDVFNASQGADGGAAKKVSIQALARLAGRYRAANHLPRWLGVWRLTLVTNNPHLEVQPSLHDLRSTLRKLLLTLSPTQISHLASHLVYNPPPSFPSYDVIKHELIALSRPPAPAPYGQKPDGSFAAAGDPLPAAGQAKPKPAAQDPKKLVVGDQPMYDEARRAMQAWHERREIGDAVSWCEREEGVELRWGQGCGLGGCDCDMSHPGRDEWDQGHEIEGDEDE